MNKGYHVLLSFVLLMAAAPVVSSSRAGAIIMALNAVLCVFVLFYTRLETTGTGARNGAVGLIILALAAGALIGWDELSPRLENLGVNRQARERIFDTGRRMAADYPLFGTGPGTFPNLFQYYRLSSTEYWPAQLHNDWLETRITFGWAGSALIAAAFVLVLLRPFLANGIPVTKDLVLFAGVSLGGCMLHARFDFPMQIYSILMLFLLLCTILSCATLRSGTSGH